MPEPRTWPPRGMPADVLLAGGLAIAAVLEAVVVGFEARTPAVALLAGVMAATLAWRRARALEATAVAMAAYTLLAAADIATNDLLGVTAVLLVLVYSVAMWEGRRRALVGLLAAALAVGAVIVGQGSRLDDFAFAAMLLGATWATGRAMRARLLDVSRMTERATRLQFEREQEAAAAVVEERARIARELHDIVSHSLTVMVVQAAGAEPAVRDAPEEATAAMQAIQEVGREAQVEMMRMLGILRANDVAAALEPAPGIEDVFALVERVRAAGLPVSLDVEGDPRPLPAGVGLTVYRLIQEALTNVRRHAGAVATRVVLRYERLLIRVSIENDPGTTPPNPGTGHGMVGMRERVASCGGSLTVESTAGGGFIVAAALPLTPPS